MSAVREDGTAFWRSNTGSSPVPLSQSRARETPTTKLSSDKEDCTVATVSPFPAETLVGTTAGPGGTITGMQNEQRSTAVEAGDWTTTGEAAPSAAPYVGVPSNHMAPTGCLESVQKRPDFAATFYFTHNSVYGKKIDHSSSHLTRLETVCGLPSHGLKSKFTEDLALAGMLRRRGFDTSLDSSRVIDGAQDWMLRNI